MARGQNTLDTQRGSLPEIRVNKDAITFVMTPPRTGDGKQLVVRCDAEGEVWISIQPETNE